MPQRELQCVGNQSITHLSVADTAQNWEWDGSELKLVAELDDITWEVRDEFALSGFSYTAPEGTVYEFGPAGSDGKRHA